MDYPKHLFKSPGSFGSGDRTYNVAGAADEDEELEMLEKGWHETKESAWAAVNLDHDGDGKAGGSVRQSGTDMQALRAQYRELAGKRAFPGWGEDILRERIALMEDKKDD